MQITPRQENRNDHRGEKANRSHTRDAAVSAHIKAACRHAAVLLHGGLLRAVLRRRKSSAAARYNVDRAWRIGGYADQNGGRRRTMRSSSIPPGWSPWASRLPSANKSGATPEVERRVMRIVTPGTLSDAALLEDKRDNLLAALWQEENIIGIAWLALGPPDGNDTRATCSRSGAPTPAEILLAENARLWSLPAARTALSGVPEWQFDLEAATRALRRQFATHDLSAFGLATVPRATAAAGALIDTRARHKAMPWCVDARSR